MLTPTVYIPIEESNRELHSKILIINELLNSGVATILGRQPMVVGNLPHMPRGVVLFKGMNAMPARLMIRASEIGHLCVATDEEGLGLSEPKTMSRNMDPGIGSVCQRFFAQGPRHAEAMETFIPGASGKIRSVGNARLDILREPFRDEFMAEAREHCDRFGDYVLFDTNLGAINSRWGGTDAFLKVLVRIGWLDPDLPDDMAFFDRRVRTEQANAMVMRRTLERLSERFPERNFIVRPHPAEREEPWIKAYENRGNVHVTSEGTHIPWLLGSALMLHTGCTTGLEAELLGVPTLGLLPMDHETLICSDLLSYQANECAVGADDAVTMAASWLTGEIGGEKGRRANRLIGLSDHVSALDGPFAFQRIAAEIVDLLGSAINGPIADKWKPLNASGFFTTREEYEAQVPGLRGADYSWSKVQIDQDGLEERFRALSGAAGDGLAPEITEVAEGVFLFSPTR